MYDGRQKHDSQQVNKGEKEEQEQGGEEQPGVDHLKQQEHQQNRNNINGNRKTSHVYFFFLNFICLTPQIINFF